MYENESEPVYVLTSFKSSERENYKIGTKLESNLIDFAREALDGKIVKEKNVTVDDKSIFLFMYPMTNSSGENIIGAMCMEFDISDMGDYIKNLSCLYMPLIIFSVVVLILIFTALFNKAVNKIITRIAHTDSLTMLPNRIAYEEYLLQLDKKISDNIGTDLKIFIVIFNIDDLRIVNDTLGNQSGDRCITTVAKAIGESFKDMATVYRIGGDEFAVIAENCTEEQIKLCLDNYEERQKKNNDENKDFVISAAYGYSGFANGTDINTVNIVRRANEKMSRRKKEKKCKSMRLPR